MDLIHEYDSTDEDTDEDSSKDIDEDSSKDDWLWERLAILCFSCENLKLLEIFKGYMLLFMKSESDELFQNIISDIAETESMGMNRQDSIIYALRKNKESIVAVVKSCKDDGDSFWCELSELGGTWDCQWFTGNECTCINCGGVSIIKMTEVYIKLFLGMRDDNLIQQIQSDIDANDEEIELDDVIDKAVDVYEKDILAKLYDAKMKLDVHHWNYSSFF